MIDKIINKFCLEKENLFLSSPIGLELAPC
jgi:hypothetical protein